MYPRVRRVLILRKGGEAKAARMAKKMGHTGESAARGLLDYVSGRRSLGDELRRRLHV